MSYSPPNIPRRREYWVVGSTAGTLIANKFAAGRLGHYVAHNGYKSQQTTERESSQQPANLWESADSAHQHDYGPRGRFNTRSASRSPQLWAAHHRRAISGITATAALAAMALTRRR